MMMIISNAQPGINVIIPNNHLRIQTARISLNLHVKCVIREENIKKVLMFVNNVNMFYMKNVLKMIMLKT